MDPRARRRDPPDLAVHQPEHDVHVVDHEVHDHVDVGGACLEAAQAVRLDEARVGGVFAQETDGGVEPLQEAGLEDEAAGVGQGFEKRLNQLGIYRYAQIAAWTTREQAWISAELGFPGRVERDDRAGQAGRLSKGADARSGSQAEVGRDS